MEKLGRHIEDFLDVLEEIIIIPYEIEKEYGKQIDKGIETTRELIKKLKKGKKSVFKDSDDWNQIP